MTKSQLKNTTSLTTEDPFKVSFKAFLWAAWKFLNLPPPTDVQLDMADFLQYGPKRRMLMAFRGVGKSWITAVYVLWRLYCDPQLNILVVSASKQRADDFSTFCMRLLAEWPLINHLYPRDDQRCSKIAFDVRPAQADHAPSVKSAGITGQITGSRADVIVPDDIEVVNNSDTQMARDKLAELVKEFDAILKPGGEIVFLGTPQNEQSLYNQLPDRGYAVRIWPARIPSATQLEKYGTKLAPFVIEKIEKGAKRGDPVDPKRFDHDDLTERELSYGRTGFALQFMLDTSLSDAEKFPLKLRDLIVMPLDMERGPTDVIWASGREQVLEGLRAVGLEGDRYYGPMFTPREFAKYEATVMFVDPSGRGKDETGWAVVSSLMSRLFLRDAGGVKGGYSEENLKHILLRAKLFGVNRILIEPNFGDGMFAHILRAQAQRWYPQVSIEDAEWARVQKEMRIIDVLEPVMNQHRLVVDQQLVERDYESTLGYPPQDQNRCRLFYQMTRITRDRGALFNDDRIDALAGAVSYFQRNMAVVAEKAVKQHRDKLLEAELKRHIEHAIGKPLRPEGAVRARHIKSVMRSKIKKRR